MGIEIKDNMADKYTFHPYGVVVSSPSGDMILNGTSGVKIFPQGNLITFSLDLTSTGATTTGITVPLVINSPDLNPNDSQLQITANGQGALQLLNYGPGDQEVLFDVKWLGGTYIAAHTTVAAIMETGGQLSFSVNDGQTIGNPASFGSPRLTVGIDRLVSSVPVTLQGYTVATLPTGAQGDTAFCTDLTTPTYLGIAVGSGSVAAPVFFDGTNWITY